MDTITQIALGAAVGEAVLGRRIGRRAALAGAAGGLIPDLDVLGSPFLAEHQALAVHRGITHSFFWAVVAGAAFAWGTWWLWRNGPARVRGFDPATGRPRGAGDAGFGAWYALWGLAFLTHALLDAFTVYGTQLLQPFSDLPVAWGSIFIIDPLYSVPLAGGLVAAWFLRRRPRARRAACLAGLALSTAYLGLTVLNQAQATARFRAELDRQGIAYERLLVTPTPANSLLWMGQADDGERVHVGLASLLDRDPTVEFRAVDKHAERLAGFGDSTPVRRLLWFSRGWYRIEQTEEGLVFHDLRFGRSDVWLTERGSFVFSFLLPDQPGNPEPDDFRNVGLSSGERERLGAAVEGRRAVFPLLLARIRGER